MAEEYTVIYQNGKMAHIMADDFACREESVRFIRGGEVVAWFNTYNIVGFAKACRDELEQGDD